MKGEVKFILWMLAICLVLTLAVMPLRVSAEVQTLPPVKQNECINLPQYCSNSTYSTIKTIRYPNGTEPYLNWAMTKNGDSYNYTFCSNRDLGQYVVNGFCDPNGIVTAFAYDYMVTTTGQDTVNTLPLFLLLGGLVVLIIAFVFNKNEYIGLFAGMLFIVASIYMMIYGLGIYADMYTRTISYISLGLGLVICFASVYEMYAGGGKGSDED